MAKVMSSRGTMVDFDLLKTKEKMANKKLKSFNKSLGKRSTISPQTMKKLLTQPVKKKEDTE